MFLDISIKCHNCDDKRHHKHILLLNSAKECLNQVFHCKIYVHLNFNVQFKDMHSVYPFRGPTYIGTYIGTYVLYVYTHMSMHTCTQTHKHARTHTYTPWCCPTMFGWYPTTDGLRNIWGGVKYWKGVGGAPPVDGKMPRWKGEEIS